MEYMGNKEYWDEKFEKRGKKALDPEKSLAENLGYFKNGSVLDIACGDGRNTIFLANNGFEVTGIDFSEKALERLAYFLKQRNLSANIKQIDLSKENSLNNIGIFDNILINHYRLSEAQLLELEKNVTDNGILFICGFGDKHKVDSRIRKEDLIQPSDFEKIKDSFDLIKYDAIQDERGYFVTYVFKKK